MDIGDLADAVLAGYGFGTSSVDWRIADVATGYLVQSEVTTRLCARRNTVTSGYKIGLTNKPSMDTLGATAPVSGRLFADRTSHCPAAICIDGIRTPIVELEICLRMARDVGEIGSEALTSVGQLVDAAFMAVEVVDNGGIAPRKAHLPSMVAANAWGHSAVLGARLQPQTLSKPIDARAVKNGVVHAVTNSAAVMGSPIYSLQWLASHLASRGLSLKRGDLVMTGAIINMGVIYPGDRLQFELGSAGMALDYSADGKLLRVVNADAAAEPQGNYGS